MSPRFPCYPYNKNIAWVVSAEDDGMEIIVKMINFSISPFDDFVAFGNGNDSADNSTIIVKLTGEVTVRTISSDQSRMWMRLVTGIRWVPHNGFVFDVHQRLKGIGRHIL